MRRIALAIVIACGCRSSGDESLERAKASVVQAEAALQRTVEDGPPDAFLAAARELETKANALAAIMDRSKSDMPGEADLHWVLGVLREPGTNADARVRMTLGAQIHDRLSSFALVPLPYTPDAAIAKTIAAQRAALAAPHGDAAEGIRLIRADADRLCSCADDACMTAAGHDFSLHVRIYETVLAGPLAHEFQAAAERAEQCVSRWTAKRPQR